MTEQEWLACEDPDPCLQSLAHKLCGRKLRLLSVACVRSVLNCITDDRFREALEFAELYSDGGAQEKRRDALLRRCKERLYDPQWKARVTIQASLAAAAATKCLMASPLQTWFALHLTAAATARAGRGDAAERAGRARTAQCALLRDIFGNPFRPVAFSPEWRTSTAVAVARGMYESRNFDAMPILADALQDAGCDSADVLEHCRGPGPHVRGCWVVDLVLGKE
jgi:hypothetical protein